MGCVEYCAHSTVIYWERGWPYSDWADSVVGDLGEVRPLSVQVFSRHVCTLQEGVICIYDHDPRNELGIRWLFKQKTHLGRSRRRLRYLDEVSAETRTEAVCKRSKTHLETRMYGFHDRSSLYCKGHRF